MRIVKWFGLLLVVCVMAVYAWAVTEKEIIEQADVIYNAMAANCLHGEALLIEEYNCRQAQSVPVLSPTLKPYYQTFEAGVMVFDPKGFSDGFINGLEGERADGIVVYPVTIYEDGKTYERIVVNASGKEIFRAKAPEGYDPLWYVWEREGTTDEHEWTQMGEGAEGEIFDSGRVVMEYQLLPIDALTEYSVAQAASQAASGGGRSMGQMSYGSNLLQFVDASWGDNGRSNEFTLAWELGWTGTIQVIHCPNLLPHAFNWSTLFVTNLPGNTNELVFTHSPSGVLGAIHAFDVNVDTDGDGVANGEERYLDKTDENNQHDPCNMLGEITYDTAHGGGGQTGLVYVVGVTSSNSWATNFADTLSSFESTGTPYHLIKLASNTNGYFVKAYRDSDGNESVGTYEAQGIYSNGSVSVTGQVTGIDVVLRDGDSDSDGMGDWWEDDYFQTLYRTASADQDVDKLCNLYEYYAGTDPTETGTEDDDDDGIKNDWETWHGLDKDDPSDADEDPDLDGFTNLEEYQNNGENFGTDPFDVLSHPTGAIYVSNTNGNDSTGDGSYTNMYASISTGIVHAVTSDRVVVMPGTYTGAANRDMGFNGEDILLLGINGAEETIIDCQQSGRGFLFDTYETTNAVLRGFTIKNGYVAGSGGAICCVDSDIYVDSCVIVSNEATVWAGGIYCGTETYLTNCVISCNVATNVDGYCGGASEGTLVDCLIEGNSAWAAGAVMWGTIIDSTVSNNSAVIWGGLASCDTYNSLILDNTAVGYGGGVAGGYVRNCLIAGNDAGTYGGGVYAGTIENCTVVDNSAPSGGGTYSGSATNSIIYYNTPTNTYSTDLYHCGTDDPDCVDPANGDYRLGFSSSCIDHGVNQTWMPDASDLAGTRRIHGGTVDIGAYEMPTRYVVAGNTNASSPYLDWTTGATTIQDAIDATVEDRGVVVVTNGVYDQGTTSVNGSLCRVAIRKPIHVRAWWNPQNTIIEGSGTNGTSAVRCAYVGTNAWLEGFMLANGETVITNDVYFGSGGGALCEDDAYVSDCLIVSNTAYNGGGVFNGKVRDCELIANEAVNGGGAKNCLVENSVLKWNVATGTGGATFNSENRSCLIERNSSDDCAGTYEGKNQNCTIVCNTGTVAAVFYASTYNSIVYYNSPSNWFLGITPEKFSYSCTIPDINGGTSSGNITNEPDFVNISSNDYHIVPGSPCENTGTNEVWMIGEVDLDGDPRIQNGSVDMGAYEQ